MKAKINGFFWPQIKSFNSCMKGVNLLLLLALAMGANSSVAGYANDRDGVMAMVAEEARAQGVDPALALAVAQVESDFQPGVRSHMGAIGVMQIMPATGLGEFGLHSWQLYNPRENIRAGISFIKQLQGRYGRNDIVLSHYNGGSRVRGRDGRLRVIPATRPYVKKVLAKARYYRSKPHLLMASYNGDSPTPSVNDNALVASNEQQGPAYSAMKKRAEALRKLRLKNLRLAQAVGTWVDPYLNRQQSAQPTYAYSRSNSRKRAEVLQWESIYRD